MAIDIPAFCMKCAKKIPVGTKLCDNCLREELNIWENDSGTKTGCCAACSKPTGAQLLLCDDCLAQETYCHKDPNFQAYLNEGREQNNNSPELDRSMQTVTYENYRSNSVPIWILVYCVLIPLVGWLFQAAYIARGDEDKAEKILIVQAIAYVIIGTIIGIILIKIM